MTYKIGQSVIVSRVVGTKFDEDGIGEGGRRIEQAGVVDGVDDFAYVTLYWVRLPNDQIVNFPFDKRAGAFITDAKIVSLAA